MMRAETGAVKPGLYLFTHKPGRGFPEIMAAHAVAHAEGEKPGINLLFFPHKIRLKNVNTVQKAVFLTGSRSPQHGGKNRIFHSWDVLGSGLRTVKMKQIQKRILTDLTEIFNRVFSGLFGTAGYLI
jgi:hypothetical protein